MHLKSCGTAFLCFQADDKLFQGVLKDSKTNVTYSIIGRESGLPETNFNECCFDQAPMFYEVEIGKNEKENCITDVIKIKDIMRLGGDNCRLILDKHFEFCTDQLLVDKMADDYIEKFFPRRFLKKDCYVCIGDISIDYTIDDSDPVTTNQI